MKSAPIRYKKIRSRNHIEVDNNKKYHKCVVVGRVNSELYYYFNALQKEPNENLTISVSIL
jgi:hypothetical protein